MFALVSTPGLELLEFVGSIALVKVSFSNLFGYGAISSSLDLVLWIVLKFNLLLVTAPFTVDTLVAEVVIDYNPGNNHHLFSGHAFLEFASHVLGVLAHADVIHPEHDILVVNFLLGELDEFLSELPAAAMDVGSEIPPASTPSSGFSLLCPSLFSGHF